MTEGNIDAETIKKSQEMLGKFVKKPPLTEKLLRKPPFKFILDVVKAVIRDTNLFDDLFTEDELNSEKDRDGKMKFLQKLIDVVKIVTNQDLQVKTSKIVAGLEADKTNELFQAIAYALENNLDSREAVNAVKNGNVINSQTKMKVDKNDTKGKTKQGIKAQPTTRDRTPSIEKNQKKLPSQRNSLERKPSIKEKEKVSTKDKTTSRSKIGDKKLKKAASKENGEEETKIQTNGNIEHNSMSPPRKNSQEKNDVNIIEQQQQQQQAQDAIETKPLLEIPQTNGDNHEVEKENEINANVKPQDELAAIIDEEAEFRRKEKQTRRNSTRQRQKSVEDEKEKVQPQDPVNQATEKVERFQSSKRESFDRPRTSLRPPSARPSSSRPAAPRRRDKNVEIILQPDENVKLGSINVRMESFTKELEDDGENLIIIEDPSGDADNFLDNRIAKNISTESGESEEDRGHLVQQILETEKNFETALGMDGVKKTEIEFDETKMQTSIKQIEHLKDLIQKLVRSLNPMGKLMDFVQEDIDSMQREYLKWTEAYKQASSDLKREQNETQSAIEPLKFQLTQLEKMIIDHHQQIDQLRGSLVMNQQRINKLFIEL